MASTSKRRVSFHPIVRGVKILSINDYTPSQIYDIWYNDEDMGHITRRAIVHVLQKSACKSAEEGNQYCMRGLEGQTRLGSFTKKKNRLDAREAVFEEQGRQWDKNEDSEEILDHEAIANAYQRVTSSCQMWAQVMGRLDRKAVESYLYQDEEEESEETNVTSTSTHSKLDSPDSRIRQRVGDTISPFRKLARAA